MTVWITRRLEFVILSAFKTIGVGNTLIIRGVHHQRAYCWQAMLLTTKKGVMLGLFVSQLMLFNHLAIYSIPKDL